MDRRDQARVYFPGLDALRAYAAISVLIVHIGTNFGDLRTQSSNSLVLELLVMEAQTAVSLFFVLSGFLITYLLLHEHRTRGTVSVRRFYARRVLRIWPVYYVVVFVGFVALPIVLGPSYAFYNASPKQVTLVIFFLANLVGPLGPLGHLWTIGLEEQFYLAWPWVLRRKNLLLPVISGVLILKLVLTPVVAAFQSDAMMILWLGFRFECMAFGALGAYLYVQKHWLLEYIYSRGMQVAAVGAFVVAVLIDVPVTTLSTFVFSALFTCLILNLATNPGFPLRLQNPVLDYLGRISYGIYMYHFPLLYVVIFSLRALQVEHGTLYDLILYGVTVSGTLLLASVSYRWLEQPFLALKSHFGEAAHPAPILVPESH